MNQKRVTICAILFLFLMIVPCIFLMDKALFWRSQKDQLLALAQDPTLPSAAHMHRPTIIFLGDSIIESFPLRATFPQQFTTINAGVHGNGISQIAERYSKHLSAIQHDAIIIEGGINNIISAVEREQDTTIVHNQIIDSYKDIINLANKPGRTVMILEILPVTNRFLLPYTQSISLPTSFDVKQVNALVVKTNASLKAISKTHGVIFIETHRKLADGKGRFSRAYAEADGYHVNVSGYKALSQVIEPYLMQLTL